MPTKIDEFKLKALLLRYAQYEAWVNAGCPQESFNPDLFPLYSQLSSASLEAYGFFRNRMLDYFDEANGWKGMSDELIAFEKEAKTAESSLFSNLRQHFASPDSKTKCQWNNLFEIGVETDSRQIACFSYQQKYEVDFPLEYLACLRSIASSGILDIGLSRYRDRNGNLRKGVLVNYIIDGLSNYSVLKDVCTIAYSSALRNTIGHNNYRIADDGIHSIDSNIHINQIEFIKSLIAISSIQSHIIRSLTNLSVPPELAKYGILCIGFVQDTELTLPTIEVYQLEPFWALDETSSWLKGVTFSIVNSSTLITKFSDAPPQSGELLPELKRSLDIMTTNRTVIVNIYPCMPCIHKAHETIITNFGEMCIREEPRNKLISAIMI